MPSEKKNTPRLNDYLNLLNEQQPDIIQLIESGLNQDDNNPQLEMYPHIYRNNSNKSRIHIGEGNILLLKEQLTAEKQRNYYNNEKNSIYLIKQ